MDGCLLRLLLPHPAGEERALRRRELRRSQAGGGRRWEGPAEMLLDELGELNRHQVHVASLADPSHMRQCINDAHQDIRTAKQHVADMIAERLGSGECVTQ